MSDSLRNIIADSAATPARQPELETILSRGRALRWRRRVATLMVSATAAVGVWVVAGEVLDRDVSSHRPNQAAGASAQENDYVISDVKIQSAAPNEILVTFDSNWVAGDTPREATCKITIFDRDGAILFQKDVSFRTESQSWNDAPLSLEPPSSLAGKPASADVGCSVTDG